MYIYKEGGMHLCIIHLESQPTFVWAPGTLTSYFILLFSHLFTFSSVNDIAYYILGRNKISIHLGRIPLKKSFPCLQNKYTYVIYASKRVWRVRNSCLWYQCSDTLSIYTSVHSQLIQTLRTLFEAYIVFNKVKARWRYILREKKTINKLCYLHNIPFF